MGFVNGMKVRHAAPLTKDAGHNQHRCSSQSAASASLCTPAVNVEPARAQGNATHGSSWAVRACTCVCMTYLSCALLSTVNTSVENRVWSCSLCRVANLAMVSRTVLPGTFLKGSLSRAKSLSHWYNAAYA